MALGLIHQPGTQVIFGAGSSRDTFDFDGIHGTRLTLGGWFDDSFRYGLEGSGFGFAQSESTFTASSVRGNIPIINIPFFSTQAASENVLVNRLPNTVTVTDSFQPYSGEINGLFNLHNQNNFPVILLAGFRFLKIDEDFSLNDASFNHPNIPNSVLNVHDDFSTRNNFYGLQIGARSNLVYQNIIFDILTKIAFGKNYQKLNISGETNVDNRTVLQPIGLFAEPTNIGHHQDSQFAFVPEIEAKVGYRLTRYIHPFVTYNCIYINKVIRAGQQLNRNINLTQNRLIGGTGVLSGPALPYAKFNNTSMWVQGVSVGFEVVI